jgi:Predicted membrane-bound metal-dependent hydrolase (DUF457).
VYSRGHVGLGLVAYAPFAGAALDAGEPGVAVVGGVLAVAIAPLPDVDQWLPIAHRGPTHTLAFAAAVGALVALAAGLGDGAIARMLEFAGASAPAWTPAFLGVTAATTLCSHLAGDAITPMGIQPFRPVSGAHFTLDLTPARNPRANAAFLAVGVAAMVASIAIVRIA